MSGLEHSGDETILRSDPSLSRSVSGAGSGEADAPRVLKQRFVLRTAAQAVHLVGLDYEREAV